MKTLRYLAPVRNILRPEGPEGPVVHGGGTWTCPNDRAEEHLTSPHYDVEEVGGGSKSRAELNDLAAQAGVDDPETLPNKDAVIAAIENPESTKED